MKDVVYLGVNETLEVIANYQPWAGVYMFHCHNLQHEDNGMMGAFNATAVNLTAFGYPDNATFTDPMAAIWRSRPVVANTSAQEMHDSILPMFLSLGAYVTYPSALQRNHNGDIHIHMLTIFIPGTLMKMPLNRLWPSIIL